MLIIITQNDKQWENLFYTLINLREIRQSFKRKKFPSGSLCLPVFSTWVPTSCSITKTFNGRLFLLPLNPLFIIDICLP